MAESLGSNVPGTSASGWYLCLTTVILGLKPRQSYLLSTPPEAGDCGLTNTTLFLSLFPSYFRPLFPLVFVFLSWYIVFFSLHSIFLLFIFPYHFYGAPLSTLSRFSLNHRLSSIFLCSFSFFLLFITSLWRLLFTLLVLLSFPCLLASACLVCSTIPFPCHICFRYYPVFIFSNFQPCLFSAIPLLSSTSVSITLFPSFCLLVSFLVSLLPLCSSCLRFIFPHGSYSFLLFLILSAAEFIDFILNLIFFWLPVPFMIPFTLLLLIICCFIAELFSFSFSPSFPSSFFSSAFFLFLSAFI